MKWKTLLRSHWNDNEKLIRQEWNVGETITKTSSDDNEKSMKWSQKVLQMIMKSHSMTMKWNSEGKYRYNEVSISIDNFLFILLLADMFAL